MERILALMSWEKPEYKIRYPVIIIIALSCPEQ